MSAVVKQVIATNDEGARLSPEQLADAGVKPGERAVVELRRYTQRDWEADHAGQVYETVDEFKRAMDEFTSLPAADE